MSEPRDITVVGAGLVGALLSVGLARRGHHVRILERRADMRRGAGGAGRSINLAISTRGLRALREVGLEDAVLQRAIPMRGRMIHPQAGPVMFQPYGKDDSEYINSVSRAELNACLMTHAEATGKVSIAFGRKVTGRDFATRTLHVQAEDGTPATLPAAHVIGTDGSASAVRRDLMQHTGADCRQEALDYGYKELSIPALPQGGFALEKNALHIWPRGTFMLIALPNFDGSFTCTLFLPHEGAISFAALRTPDAVQAFFDTWFADAVPLLRDLQAEFSGNPVGNMVTVKCHPWSAGDHTLLLGDAAHAIVPFFGQGANCGFEDCTVFNAGLDALKKSGDGDWRSFFERFARLRKPHTDAIADMAVENFVEMRDKVGNARFLLEKAVEKRLQHAFAGRFLSRYAMVTFSNMPYRAALDAGVVADAIVRDCCRDITRPEAVDLDRAATLIDSRLRPLIHQHAQGSNPWI